MKSNRMLYCIFILMVFCQAVISQSRALRDRLNAGECTTCRVGSWCQPHPMAGSEGFADLGYTIQDFYGTKEVVRINARPFNIFNATAEQKSLIIATIELLPPEYVAMLPANFRVGNPNRPYGIASAGREIGGSKKCTPFDPANLQFESIVLHEAIFRLPNKKHRTILHEMGHFFARQFNVFGLMTPEQVASSSTYLADVYSGATSSHEETIAQCFMYFFSQMYYDGNTRRAMARTFDEIVPQPARGFQSWMCTFIKPVIRDTSSL